MRNKTIRTKLFFSFAVAIIAAVLIGLCGLLNIAGMNKVISSNDYSIVQPLVSLNRITFDVGQIRINVRDIIIEDAENHEETFVDIAGYQEDIRKHINGYLDDMYNDGLQGTDEYSILSEMSVKVSEWSIEMENVARLYANGQTGAALELLYGTVMTKGSEVNELLESLVKINEDQASKSRESAVSSFMLFTFLIAGLLIIAAGFLIAFGLRMTPYGACPLFA